MIKFWRRAGTFYSNQRNLIGGWAIYLHTKALKSKDIGIIVDFQTLNQLV